MNGVSAIEVQVAITSRIYRSLKVFVLTRTAAKMIEAARLIPGGSISLT
jgi:hypothetical protein